MDPLIFVVFFGIGILGAFLNGRTKKRLNPSHADGSGCTGKACRNIDHAGAR